MAARAALVVAAAGCARMAPPPGGPPDAAAPILLATIPESLMVLPDWDRDVEFRFDETVSEGTAPNFGLGTGDLERLVLLSPSTEVPVVRWRRNRITVHPRDGWRPGVAYRIELLAGVADLRNNRMRTSALITFTTDTVLPTTVLRGMAVDWTTARPAPQALIQAIGLPDTTLVYRTTADSTGEFTLGPLPEREWLVRAVLDQNRNRTLDRQEPFDTVRVAAGNEAVGELWAFRHDSLGPRIIATRLNDSLSISVQMNQAVDPYQEIAPDSVVVRAVSDSSRATVVAVLSPTAYDSLYPRRPPRDTAGGRARPDSAAADTGARAPAPPPPPVRPESARIDSARGPLTTRPKLSDRLVIRLDAPLAPGERYTVDLFGVRNPAGSAGGGGGRGVLEVPAARPTAARPDSTRPDSLVRPDTGQVTPNQRLPTAPVTPRPGMPDP